MLPVETVRLDAATGAAKVRVVRALWGPPGEEDRFKDVTGQVRRMLASGLNSRGRKETARGDRSGPYHPPRALVKAHRRRHSGSPS